MGSELVPVAAGGRDQRIAGLAQVFIQGRRSPHTRRAYEQHLGTWIDWCAGNGVDLLEARHAHVSLWLAFLQEAGASDSTRAARLSAISSWYRWMQREGVVTRNPATLLPEERPRPNPEHTPALSAKQAELLLAAADADGHRSSALIALMLYTGARIGELLPAQISDIIQEAGVPVLRIVGKGRKRRSLPVIPAVYQRLDRYLRSRPHAADLLPTLPGHVNARSQPLFVTSTGKPLDPKQVRRILLRCAKRAGLEPEVVAQLTPHSTRATYATSNLAAGTPLRDVQYALGHEDPRTTEGYDRSDLQLDRHPSSRLAAVIRPPTVI
ncbi:tyrosine-type recombinase/integrase [Catelliglobosispora koreensis]|uniref:tyrosine-type recombinase/integrase n=1 Tax=Catelliglobosispora koreensis TaxID=129052 RepID=UPI00035F8FE2|nr:tyrosine-type recombinase/integrase [Catelliglobosispora koreensis]